jgi:hypothetical protein
MIERRMVIATTLACLALAGCGQKAAEGTKATGEVLDGTISDSMIATDETRSPPPLAPYSPKAADTKSGKGKPRSEGSVEQASPDAKASSAAEAAPSPKPSPSETPG